ncbi:hypothetical protein KAR48_18535 [bacterium]|nr:hypothetical protein [bacterium]
MADYKSKGSLINIIEQARSFDAEIKAMAIAPTAAIQSFAASIDLGVAKIKTGLTSIASYEAIQTAVILGQNAHIASENAVAMLTPQLQQAEIQVAMAQATIIPEIVSSNTAIFGAISSIAATQSLADLYWDQLGSKIGMEAEAQIQLQNDFAHYTQMYNEVMFNKVNMGLTKVLDYGIHKPTVHYYNSVDILHTISPTRENEDIREQDKSINKDIKENLNEVLPALLHRKNPNYLQSWVGAQESLKSANVDKTRHICVSLRELLTRILHELAPNDKIKEWKSDSHLYHNDKPTRSARLFYLYRNINSGPFQKFIENDVKTLNEFFRIYQNGTHDIDSNFTFAQLEALIKKTGTIIFDIITISEN